MAKELRVSFAGAPGFAKAQVFGKVKNRENILKAMEYFDGHAHVKEIWHFLNTKDETDAKGNPIWLKVKKLNKRTGKEEWTVPFSLAVVTTEVATLVAMDELKRIGGERSASVALPGYEETEEDAEADVSGDEDDEEYED